MLMLYLLLNALFSAVKTEDIPDMVTISVKDLKASLKEVKVLDVAYNMTPPMPFDEFKQKYYGKFELLMKEKKNEEFEKEHIPGSVHFNIDIATFPGQYEKASLYPASLFSEYVRLLGVSSDDRVVVVGRGNLGGMLFAARVWWLFKVYGMNNVRVLDGGLAKWKEEGGEVTSEIVTPKPGNWTAKEIDQSLIITYDELTEKKGNGARTIDTLYTINFLDARPAAEFSGAAPIAVAPNGATGNHLKGSKNVPLPTIIENGQLASADKIKESLSAAHYKEGAPVVTSCNGGTQAALLGLALARVGIPFRLFNGSLREISLRAPSLISEKDK